MSEIAEPIEEVVVDKTIESSPAPKVSITEADIPEDILKTIQDKAYGRAMTQVDATLAEI